MIDPQGLKRLAEAVKARSKAEAMVVEGEELEAYYLEELSVTYQRGEFFGLSLDVLGREWSLFHTGDAMVSMDEGGRLSTYRLTDKALTIQLNKFLDWRLETLQATHPTVG